VSAHYKDVELLGRGGMGVVLRAFDPKRREWVAVKILSPLLSDRPALVARFMREIKALQTVAHPGVVGIYDVTDSGDNPWYSMELIEGTDFKTVLRDRGTFSLLEARDVFSQLFDVVGHIHGHGVIHRDLKPDNILLTPAGRVKLLDFGLAHVPEASQLTQDGEVMGTLRYMSPEQMDGQELTPASDVFSCALVAFECMTGRMPFPEMGRMLHYSGTIMSLESLLPGTPPGLSDLFMRALSPRADLRPPDASKLAREWARIWAATDATLPPKNP
jgi:serine/threonine protein kinase